MKVRVIKLLILSCFLTFFLAGPALSSIAGSPLPANPEAVKKNDAGFEMLISRLTDLDEPVSREAAGLLIVQAPGERYRLSFRLIARGPEAVRMEIFDPFGRPMLYLVSFQGTIRLFSISQKREIPFNLPASGPWSAFPHLPVVEMLKLFWGRVPIFPYDTYQSSILSEKGKEKALAQYLPMYSHRHGTNHEILSRPGQNYPMIILTNNSTKLEIIHEYMHHYLTCREGEQAFSVDGIDHSLGCKVILNRIALNKERDQVREQLIKKEKELENFGLVTTFAQLKKYADLEKEMLKLAKQSWSLTGKLVLNEVEIVMQFPAEELDIHRYTYQHSDDLHLDPSEQKWDLYAMADYFNEIFDDLYKDQQGNFTYSFMNAVSLFKGTGLYTDDNKELRSLYDQISVALREVDQKMLKTFLWLEPRKPPQS